MPGSFPSPSNTILSFTLSPGRKKESWKEEVGEGKRERERKRGAEGKTQKKVGGAGRALNGCPVQLLILKMNKLAGLNQTHNWKAFPDIWLGSLE